MNLSSAPAFAEFITGPQGSIAYARQVGHAPGVMFLHGFNSDMQGQKAVALAEFCSERGQAYLRFDCRAHGQSGGDFADFTIGGALEDALYVFDHLTEGPQILAGSSMGGWLAFLLALARPERVHTIIGLAPAPDFTDDMFAEDLTPEQQDVVMAKGYIELPSIYGGTYVVSKKLIEEGRRNFVIDKLSQIKCPLRILHGQQDADVKWQQSLDIAARWGSDDVQVNLIKSGDHRLSEPADLQLLRHTLMQLLDAP